MYQPQFNYLRDQILDLAGRERDKHPEDWAALAHRSDRFIRRVAWACQVAGLVDVGLNGKRGNPNDLSTDVLAFPNASGCRDASGLHPGLELHDIIYASDDAQQAHLTWGDATQKTIDGGVPGAWVQPSPDGDHIPPPPPPNPDDDLKGAYDTLKWFVNTYDQVVSMPPSQRPELTRDQIVDALKNLRDACERIVEVAG